MAQTRSPLPPPAPDQVYVTISPMAAGFITLQDSFFVHPAETGAKRTVPSLAFLIERPPIAAFGANRKSEKPFRLMFDLGLRRAKERYPEVTQKHLEGRTPYNLSPGVAEQLSKGGLDPADVNLVIISHVHYDHHGDPEDFPQARFLVGNGAMNVLKNGLGGIASHQHFDANLLPKDRSDELSAPTNLQWKPMGPFPAVLDLFSDGSVFVIDTPGHLPGHLNLLCRTKERWICLCGDAFHDRRLLTGEKEIGTWEGPEGNTLCIHLDKEGAAESIRRLQEFEKAANGEVELIAAHEDQWWELNKHKAFPGTI